VSAKDAAMVTVRSRELAQVEELLARREPAVVTVSGPTGIGKSTLLSAVGDLALAADWQSVGARREPGTPGLAATAETTMAEIASAIVDELEPWTAARTAGQSARATTANENGSATTAPSAETQFLPPVERAVTTLEQQHKPVAILFDGYRPSRDVDQQVVAMFDRARSARALTVIVAADREPEKTALGEAADLHIVLGAFAEDDVRAYLDELTAGVEPPLTSAERDVYVDAARQRPDLLDSLARLFGLIAPDSRRAPEEAR
jgi:hypothetical protein